MAKVEFFLVVSGSVLILSALSANVVSGPLSMSNVLIHALAAAVLFLGLLLITVTGGFDD